MSLEFLFYVPNTIESGHRGDDTKEGWGTLDFSAAIAEAAVAHGFSGALIGAGWGRSDTFTIATALELVEESGRADFTIQTLIDRSNLSLRAFYQHFAGKEELLLALYENATSQFIEAIRQEVAAADGPMEQHEAFCRGFLSRAESCARRGFRQIESQSAQGHEYAPQDTHRSQPRFRPGLRQLPG